MNRICQIIALLSILSISLFGSHAATAEETPAMDIRRLKKEYIPDLEKALSKLQGSAAAIIYQGDVIYQRTFGRTSTHGSPITQQTLFPLASCSKPVMATVVAKMVRDKQLNLDAKVPSTLALKQNDLTLRHLLSHSSGYIFSGNREVERRFPREKIMLKLRHLPPDMPSGTHYYYSNFVFSLIQDAVENATHENWTLAVDQFWKTLGVQSVAQCHVPQGFSIASPHIRNKKTNKVVTLARTPRNYPETVCAAGGFFASLHALSEFVKLNLGYHDQVLDYKDLEAFHTPYIEARDPFKWNIRPGSIRHVKAYYGLGWRILDFRNDPQHYNRMVFHSGFLNGINTFIGFWPYYDIGIVILSNEGSKTPVRYGMHLWKMMGHLALQQ